jgi:hypothetical protein
LKSKRETILEFLRIQISENNRDDHQYLVIAKQEKEPISMKDVNPYNQADQLFLQCDLLQEFAKSQLQDSHKAPKTEEQILKRRIAKEKRKLSHKLFVQDLLLIEEELKELKTVDAALSKARIDYKNLTTQMFAERFNLSNINTNRVTGGSRFS